MKKIISIKINNDNVTSQTFEEFKQFLKQHYRNYHLEVCGKDGCFINKQGSI